MIPGPRPSDGQHRPGAGRDRGTDVLPPLSPAPVPGAADGSPGPGSVTAAAGSPLTPVALTRTARGWSVRSPAGTEPAGNLIEGLSLADLVAEEFGVLTEPDRTARRSARGPSGTAAEAVDPVQARVAELERTVAQLEHALAARVSTERAIGVLAERHGTSPRAAFEWLRRDARSQGRPVAQLAREVLDGLSPDVPEAPATGDVPPAESSSLPAARSIPAVVAPPVPRTPGPAAVTTADGVS